MSATKQDGAAVVNLFQALRDLTNPDIMPAYEGKDPRIQEEPWCVTCHCRPASGLLCCSRCHTAWYCNSTCQRIHFKSGHKETCLAVARALEVVEREAIPLRNALIGFDPKPQSFFETQAGLFGGWDETLSYLTVRCHLVEMYVQTARDVEIKDIWEKALFHALEVLRLDVVDKMTMREETPYILLALHRDDDAFDFIRYWTNLNRIRIERISETLPLHLQSKEGDWIYQREKDCRFLDIFEACPDANDRVMNLTFLVALLIIKCRIIAIYDATRTSIDLSFNTVGGGRIEEVEDVVKEMLIDECLVKIENQRQQVEQLIQVIHRNNVTMLPSILNPIPLMTNNCSPIPVRGEPSEALHVLRRCRRFFARVPGAEEILEKHFGKNPSYNL